MAADPVGIVARGVRAIRYAERGAAVGTVIDAEDELIAADLLTALHDAGWRIVRTSLDEPYQYVNITDEWRPEPSPEEPCG